MRVLVCGGCDFTDQKVVNYCLDRIHAETPISLIIHGAARGADTLGGQWALFQNIKIMTFPADWKRYGKSAGSIRNQQMLKESNPELVVAFPGGAGTAHMVSIARKANFAVLLV